MRAWMPLAALTLLAACGTPQQQCIAGQTRELRVIDRLIAGTDRNLSRGYAVEERTEYRPDWVDCGPVRRDRKGRLIRPGRCFEDRPITVRTPVAIDPAAENRKLEGLQSRRVSLAARATPAIAACQAQYPD